MVEQARKRTGVRHMRLRNDYDKAFARSYGLVEHPQPNFDHKDGMMSQPAFLVLNSNAEIVFFWKSVIPGPKGRPRPEKIMPALVRAIGQHGPTLTAEDLAPFLPSREEMEGGEKEFVLSLLHCFKKEGFLNTVRGRFGPWWMFTCWGIFLRDRYAVHKS